MNYNDFENRQNEIQDKQSHVLPQEPTKGGKRLTSLGIATVSERAVRSQE